MRIDLVRALWYASLAALTIGVSAPARAQASAAPQVSALPKLYNNAKQKLLEGKILSS